jgi:hypothetical protein
MAFKSRRLLPLLILLVTPITASAAIVTFNSPDAATSAATRAAWLAAIGIAAPENLVDFESGFADGQNIDDVAALFPEGLVIRDTSAANQAIVRSGAGIINGSNPVGVFSVTHNELAFLVLDFAANPVDYFGFLDIDQAGTTGSVFFEGGGSAAIAFETTAVSGNTAEFFGIFRNDQPRIVRVELDASGDGRWGVDNIEYGQVAQQAPEPSVFILLSVGLASLRLVRSRQRR